jgi:pyridoxal biosynthesis lyase PdxS
MSNGNGNGEIRIGTDTVKMGLAQMLKGGVIVSLFWTAMVRL